MELPLYGVRERARFKGYPSDLRDDGNVNDSAFDRPLVVGRITDGVVETRDPQTGEMVRHEVAKGAISSKPPVDVSVTADDPKMERTIKTKEEKDMTILDDDIRNRVEQVAKLYIEGKSYGAIAQAVGVSRSTVMNDVNRAVDLGLIKEKRGGLNATGDSKPALNDVGVLGDRIEELSKRIEKIEERQETADRVSAPVSTTNPDSRSESDLEALWKPFAEAFRKKIDEIRSIREEMRDLGIDMDEYFPNSNSPNLAKNGQKRGSDVA